MYQSQLIEGLIRQAPKTTLTQYATWTDTSIWKVLFKRLKDLSSSKKEIERHFKDRSNEILREQKDDYHRIAAKLIHTMAETAEVEIKGIYSEEGLKKIGKEIEESAIKKLQSQTKGDFKGTTLNELKKYVVKQMLEQMEKQFKKKSSDEKREIAKKLLDVIDELPPEEVEKIKDQLGVNQLSNEAVRKAISTGVFSVAIASAINLGGFGSYIFAVKALAAVSGLVGVTLPFAVYTTLTSWMAALSNPFLVLPAAVGFGWFMTTRGNKKIRESMLTQFVAQIALAGQKEKTELDPSEIAKYI